MAPLIPYDLTLRACPHTASLGKLRRYASIGYLVHAQMQFDRPLLVPIGSYKPGLDLSPDNNIWAEIFRFAGTPGLWAGFLLQPPFNLSRKDNDPPWGVLKDWRFP